MDVTHSRYEVHISVPPVIQIQSSLVFRTDSLHLGIVVLARGLGQNALRAGFWRDSVRRARTMVRDTMGGRQAPGPIRARAPLGRHHHVYVTSTLYVFCVLCRHGIRWATLMGLLFTLLSRGTASNSSPSSCIMDSLELQA